MEVIHIIKNKKILYLAFILFAASMVLNFPFPHESPYGETVISVLNIPVQSINGLQYVGITSLALLIVSLYFLAKSVNKYHGRVVLIAIIIAFAAPSLIVSSFQKTLATGIYAVSYKHEESNCNFEMIDAKTLRGKCELPFDNHSRKDVQFTIEFYEKYLFEDDIRMVSLMNNNADYEVKLKGNESKTLIIESDIDVSNIENHVESGSSTGVNIVIKSKGKVRKL
ncbi:hypothetical protein [Mesobacillus foraminis]|uniref:Uncharacterized protein n=1 Tax=Mesobacillus foraminis TaxID=279826 RepID=A0A4R2B6G4_9BACI|nr:hypothetical protein [Mesobacillus foraminis]TCN22301.1 hypothetical protein EV146_111140 [Mesobacillus foraminis]